AGTSGRRRPPDRRPRRRRAVTWPSERKLGDREEPGHDLEEEQDQGDLQRLSKAPHYAAVLPPVVLELQRELAVHFRHRLRLGGVDRAGGQILRVEAATQ